MSPRTHNNRHIPETNRIKTETQALSYGSLRWIQVLALEAAHLGGSFEAMLHTDKFKENSTHVSE